MKTTKYSDAMLRGFAQVNGRQCRGAYSQWDAKGNAIAHCAVGAVFAGREGSTVHGFVSAFAKAWGVNPMTLNDKERMEWEHIYGMARAAGL